MYVPDFYWLLKLVFLCNIFLCFLVLICKIFVDSLLILSCICSYRYRIMMLVRLSLLLLIVICLLLSSMIFTYIFSWWRNIFRFVWIVCENVCLWIIPFRIWIWMRPIYFLLIRIWISAWVFDSLVINFLFFNRLFMLWLWLSCRVS